MNPLHPTDSLSAAARLCPVDRVSFIPASVPMRQEGLLGWVRLRLFGGFVLRDVELRRSREGTLYLSYPTRRSKGGREHSICYPEPQFAEAILLQVLAVLKLEPVNVACSKDPTPKSGLQAPAA